MFFRLFNRLCLLRSDLYEIRIPCENQLFYQLISQPLVTLRQHIYHARNFLRCVSYIAPSLTVFVNIPSAINVHNMQYFNLSVGGIPVDNSVFSNAKPKSAVGILLKYFNISQRCFLSKPLDPFRILCFVDVSCASINFFAFLSNRISIYVPYIIPCIYGKAIPKQ